MVELTEHRPVADYPTLVAAVAELRLRDAKLAVDDAGAGYAGLQHLMLPPGPAGPGLPARAAGRAVGGPARRLAARLAATIRARQTAQTFGDSVAGLTVDAPAVRAARPCRGRPLVEADTTGRGGDLATGRGRSAGRPGHYLGVLASSSWCTGS